MRRRRQSIFYKNGLFSDLGGIVGGIIGAVGGFFGGGVGGAVPGGAGGYQTGQSIGKWIEGRIKTGRVYGTASIVMRPGAPCENVFLVLNHHSTPEQLIKDFFRNYPEEITRCNICMEKDSGIFYECETGYAGSELEPVDVTNLALVWKKYAPYITAVGVILLGYTILKWTKVIK